MPQPISPLTPKRVFGVCGFLAVLSAVIAACSLAVGPTVIPFPKVCKGLLAQGGWPGLTDPLNEAERMILWSIRLPRVLTAGLVGASLACAGAVFQGLFRNPLADPYVLGVSGGAAVGALTAILLGFDALPFGVSLLAFVGGFASLLLVWAIAGVGGIRRPDRLLLAGVVLNAFFSALILLFVSRADPAKLRGALFWLMGDLSGADGSSVRAVIGFLVAGFLVIFLQARALNILQTGEEEALILGVPVARVRTALLVSASLMTGAAVAAAGIIGFVGLMVPHLLRFRLGSDFRLLLPAVLLFGGAFLMTADTIARTLAAPTELPVGAVTALCGAPYFVYLMKRTT